MVESLLSMIVIALALMILAGALMTSAKNTEQAGRIVSGEMGQTESIGSSSVSVGSVSGTVGSVSGTIGSVSGTINIYQTGDENMPLYYYRYDGG